MGEVDIKCVRAADFDYLHLAVHPQNLPTRSVSKSDLRARQLRPGDLVLEKSGGGELQPVGRVVRWDLDEVAVSSNFAARIRPAPGTSGKFLAYLMDSLYTSGVTKKSIKQTTGIQNLDLANYLDEQVAAPPDADQRAIADFLDAQTARIDTLINKKRLMSNLLAKRRSATISNALWRASPSERVRVRHLSGRPTSGNRDHSSFTFTENGVPCLRGLNIRPARIDRRNLLQIDESAHRIHANTALSAGDLVIVRSGFAGSAVLVPPDLDGCNCVDLVIVRKSSVLIPRYLEYVVNSQEAQEQVRQKSSGALLSHFNAVDAGDLVIPLRELRHQARIVDELDDAMRSIDQLIRTIERQIGLLHERRQALITAAVTGEMEIPGVRR